MQMVLCFDEAWLGIFYIYISTGQDGTLQSFSTIHEKFNKSLGHGRLFTRLKKICIDKFSPFLDEVKNSCMER